MIHDRATALGTGIDGAVRRITRTYDTLDRLWKVTSYDNATVGSGSIVNDILYNYGKFGVVETIYQAWAGQVYVLTSPKVTCAWSFPTDGTTGLRRTSTTYPGGTVVTEVYDSGMDDTLSRLSGRKKGTDWLFQDEYLGLGRLVEREYGGTGVTWSLVSGNGSLDRFNRAERLVVEDTSTTIADFTYYYDYTSRITRRDDDVANIFGSYAYDEKMVYDDLGRITDHDRGVNGGTSNLLKSEDWTLDHAGKWDLYATEEGEVSTDNDGDHNDSNEIEEISVDGGTPLDFDHDNAGHMTTRTDTQDHVFDAWGRLVEVKVSSSTVAKYEYNGFNQKVKRTDSSSQPDTYYYYNGENQLVEERKVSPDELIAWYVWGTQYIDDLVVRSTGSASTDFVFYVQDARFNTVRKLDSTGAVTARYIYDAFGHAYSVTSNWQTWSEIAADEHLFQGRHYLADHAQYDFRNRWQDPELGVFVTRDPIGIWGDEVNFGNGYAFVGNDPVNKADPYGLQEAEEILRIPDWLRPPDRDDDDDDDDDDKDSSPKGFGRIPIIPPPTRTPPPIFRPGLVREAPQAPPFVRNWDAFKDCFVLRISPTEDVEIVFGFAAQEFGGQVESFLNGDPFDEDKASDVCVFGGVAIAF